MEDILSLAVDHARSMGASYSEARYHRIEYRILTLRGDRLVSTTNRVSEGVGVRVIYNGSLAFSSTSIIDREAIINTTSKAISRVRTTASLMRRKITMSPERVGRASYEVKPRRSFENEALGNRISDLRELYKIAQSSLKEARLSSFMVNYIESIEEKIIINSDGAYIRSRTPRIEGFVNIVLAQPGRGSVSKWFEAGAVSGLELFDEIRLREKISELASSMENILIRGVSPPSGKVDVVIGSELVGLMMHEGVGHPLEADRVLGREAAQAGESYVKPGDVGRLRIGNRYANVIDDPTIPGSSGYYLYDDEGVPARPKILYREGVVVDLLHNRETASEMGVSSNASSRSMNHASEPIIRMSNTYLAPGEMSFEELIEDIELGVYIKNNMEWNIDDTRWQHRYIGLEAFLIEKGELTEPVRNPVLEITTGEFLSSIAGADRNLEFFPGTCGKGEPSQGVPVWMGGPNARISRVSLGVAPID